MPTMELPRKLTDEEVRQRGVALAQALERYEAVEKERKDAMAEFKETLSEVDGEIHELAKAVATGQETAEVEVAERAVSQSLTVETFRVDTGETIATRAMSPDERQMVLFHQVGPKADEAINEVLAKAQADAEAERQAEQDALAGEADAVATEEAEERAELEAGVDEALGDPDDTQPPGDEGPGEEADDGRA